MRARVAGEEKVAKKRGPVRESAKVAISVALCANRVSERGRSGVGAGPIGTAT